MKWLRRLVGTQELEELIDDIPILFVVAPLKNGSWRLGTIETDIARIRPPAYIVVPKDQGVLVSWRNGALWLERVRKL